MKNIKLNNGLEIPAIGLGTWQSTSDEVMTAVSHALTHGYTHIDTAAIYGNEKEVGEGIRKSGVDRKDIFLTTKLWNNISTYDAAVEAFEASLERLGTDYLDLYLIHWPGSYKRIQTVWKAMEDLYEQGKIKAIGVSNFEPHHLSALMETAKVKPVVNQVECHVKVQCHFLQDICAKHDIYLQAYAPMMSWKVKELVADETLLGIAKKYGKTPSQVALRWLFERDIIVLPKSVTPSRIEENINILDFSLDAEDMAAIRLLNDGVKLFPHPDNIDLGFNDDYAGEPID
ncbi:glyoxal reductase (plasmid) [Fulvitalea axinellae]|uniref:Glyoxal reductase n=1 Tax=Fulvitalea axinellae TaxID=1182444 RepID=A0AAU9CJ86_9BACT|nr:glyoxal reductase [Fulvitalea axinellae]